MKKTEAAALLMKSGFVDPVTQDQEDYNCLLIYLRDLILHQPHFFYKLTDE